jgi:dUTP pyrophosphatase
VQKLRLKVLDQDLYKAELGDGGFGPRNPGDAGIDLRSTRTCHIGRGETTKIGLGIAIELPHDSVGWLTGRSSTSLAWGLLTHEGKIDAGYRGQIHAIVTALTDDVTIERGERIAQLVVVRIYEPGHGLAPWTVVDELSGSARGARGLGSTGRA